MNAQTLKQAVGDYFNKSVLRQMRLVRQGKFVEANELGEQLLKELEML